MRLVAAGLAQEDEALAKEYAAWLGELSPDQVEIFRPTAPFLPLGYFPDDPHLVKAAELVFAAPHSRWRPLHDKLAMGWQEFLTSPLVSVPAFQKLLVQELKNTAELGRISVDAEKPFMNLTFGRGRHGQLLANSRDPDLPPDAGPRPVRVCDVYAWQLSRLEGSHRSSPTGRRKRKMRQSKSIPSFSGNPLWTHTLLMPSFCVRSQKKFKLRKLAPLARIGYHRHPCTWMIHVLQSVRR